jgi:hypothetical protein
VVVHCVVEVGVSVTISLGVACSLLPSEDAVSATGRNAAELLDVDVNELPRRCFLLAHNLWLPNRQAGRLIDLREERHLVAGKNAPNGRARDVEVMRDPVWPPPSGESESNDSTFGALCGSTRRRQGFRGSVGKRKTLPVARGPL